MQNFTIHKFTVGWLETNCYILTLKNITTVIDPGADAKTIISYLEANKLIPDQILLTHAHIDHISAVKEVADKYGTSVYLNENDEELYNSPANSIEPIFPSLSKRIKTTSKFNAAGIEAIFTPGHTKGGTCFYAKEAKLLISGDTIFNESIGRTDLPGGNHNQIIKSINDKILTLPPETIIYPGHGPETSVDHESKYNPYF
ncbi:MAG: MBL fold metallo-hydrolase [Lentisphaerota bacterium]